jgi:hypothetical protein
MITIKGTKTRGHSGTNPDSITSKFVVRRLIKMPNQINNPDKATIVPIMLSPPGISLLRFIQPIIINAPSRTITSKTDNNLLIIQIKKILIRLN